MLASKIIRLLAVLFYVASRKISEGILDVQTEYTSNSLLRGMIMKIALQKS